MFVIVTLALVIGIPAIVACPGWRSYLAVSALSVAVIALVIWWPVEVSGGPVPWWVLQYGAAQWGGVPLFVAILGKGFWLAARSSR